MFRTYCCAVVAGLLVAACGSDVPADNPAIQSPAHRQPTRLAPGASLEGDGEGDARLAWIESMHRAAPEVDWHQIERGNRRATATRLKRRGSTVFSRSGQSSPDPDSLAPGLRGRWYERGSTNQAGSVNAIAYDAAADLLYAISAGGTLWSGPLDGSNWQVIDQSQRFGINFLEVLPATATQPMRLLATIDRRPAYSDNGGRSWTVTTDISAQGGYWDDTYSPVVLGGPGEEVLYSLTTAGYFEPVQVLTSADRGASWSVVATLDITLADKADLIGIPGTSTAVLVDANADSYVVSQTGIILKGAYPADYSFGKARVTGGLLKSRMIEPQDTFALYTYSSDNIVYRSVDTASTWQALGTIPETPWAVGIYANPSNGNELLAGGVEAFTSTDGGKTWNLVNRWVDYYNDVEGSLHADMMAFGHFKRSDGSQFTISANHGGLNLTESWFDDSENIGMSGLNVGQLYSVVSDPRYPGFVFAGSQDQGFQRGQGNYTNAIAMEQTISGDYGHLTFDSDGKLWMMYPGTDASVYRNPTNESASGYYSLDSDNESVWLAPLVAHPDPNTSGVLLAGANVDGGAGSHIIHLTEDNFDISAQQFDFDFASESVDGVLSALGTSPLSQNRIYAATSNGRFFYSDDAGASFEQSTTFVPVGNFLYGQAIVASPTEEDVVYLAGSGYGAPAVWRSNDGGVNFVSDVVGLPNTLVYEMAMSPDGEYLFAATEAGPYVQLRGIGKWVSLHVDKTPIQTYWSVEYVASDSIARFGTYGRGIWDLKLLPPLKADVISSTTSTEALDASWSIYPNPASERIEVRYPAGTQRIQLFDVSGRLVIDRRFQAVNSGSTAQEISFDLNAAAPGAATLTLTSANGTVSSKPLIIR